MYSGIIYCIVSKDGKKYYGKTINTFKKRIKQHLIEKRNCKISNALRKYGKDYFSYNIIEKYEFISRGELISKLNEREIYWIDKDQTQKFGYNMTPGGDRGSDTTGKLSTIDLKTGEKFFVSREDPRYISGQLVSVMKGFLSAYDLDGIRYRIKRDDPRYLNGKLKAIPTGCIRLDKRRKVIIGLNSVQNNKKDKINHSKPQDPIKSYSQTQQHRDNISKSKTGIPMAENTKKLLSSLNMGHTRQSNELNSQKGKKWMINPERTQKSLIKIEETQKYLTLGWIFGRKSLNK